MKGPPDLDQLLVSTRRIQLADYGVLALFLLVDGWLAWQLATKAQLLSLFVPLALLALSVVIHLGWSFLLFYQPKVALSGLAGSDRVGAFSAEELRSTLQELLSESPGREAPELYFTEPRFDGAYVVNSLFFNAPKPLNAIYLSRHLCSVLGRVELKAVLAHEFAHFRGYMRPLHRMLSATMIFNALLPAYLLMDGAGRIGLWGAAALWFAFSVLFMRGLNYWLGAHGRSFEFLCDLSAARRYGILAMINGLIVVARMLEVQAQLRKRLLERIRADDTLSVDHLEILLQRCENRLPEGALGLEELDAALDAELADPNTEKLRRRRAASARSREEKAVEALVAALSLKRAFRLINWGRFDTVSPDGRIQAEEYPQLIEALEAEPEGQLFDLPTDNVELVAKGSHPTVGERILFLERRRRADPSIQL